MIAKSNSIQSDASPSELLRQRPPRFTWPSEVAERRLHIKSLKDCTALRQSLEGRPPALMHAVVWVSLALVVVALVWAGFTRANLVVRAVGRVRPVDVPLRLFAPRGTKLDGRVAAVHVREGDEVRQGAVLLEF